MKVRDELGATQSVLRTSRCAVNGTTQTECAAGHSQQQLLGWPAVRRVSQYGDVTFQNGQMHQKGGSFELVL